MDFFVLVMCASQRMKSAVLKSLDLVGAKPASVPPEKKAVVSGMLNAAGG